MSKYVVFYESAPDVATNAPPHLTAHIAHWQEFQNRGELLMIGTLLTRLAIGVVDAALRPVNNSVF